MIEQLVVLNPAAFSWGMITPVLPELVLLAIGVALIVLDLFAPRQRQLLPWMTVLGVSAVLLVNLGMYTPAEPGAMLRNDAYSAFFCTLCLASVILAALMREFYSTQVQSHQGEFYSLLVFSAVGMMIMVASVDLITIYLGLELMALPIYVLTGMHKKDLCTSEAAAKYFLMGVFASALLLFGMSLLFGLTGTTNLAEIGAYIGKNGLATNASLVMALALLIAGLCFKVAVVPFHMWTPDVYEGAPTVLTAFMSVGPKAAGFAVFGRIMLAVFPELHANWGPVLALLAVLTMLVGNITALVQSSLKRMLAYSAIAHAGYALLGIAAGSASGMAAAMSYLFIYLFMNMGAFAILIIFSHGMEQHESIDSCRGMASRNPVLALCMLIFMFSLTGIPPTGGFTGKFYLFQSAVAAGYTAAVIAAVLLSAMSAFFYLRVIRLMYMSGPEQQPVITAPSVGMLVVLGIAVAGVLVTGVVPGALFDWAQRAMLP